MLEDVIFERCSFVGLSMRAVTSGVSAGGTLALAHHLLALSQPRIDPTGLCPPCSAAEDFNWKSFSLGLAAGALLFGLVELLITIRWGLVQVVGAYLAEKGREASPPPKLLYKVL